MRPSPLLARLGSLSYSLSHSSSKTPQKCSRIDTRGVRTSKGFSTHFQTSPYPPAPASQSPKIPPRTPHAWTPTPFITETVGGSWHTYDIFSRLLKERIVCLNGAVDDTVSASVVAQLLFLEADDPGKGISLYINSPGGSVSAGLAIYDCMRYIGCDVSTICVGQAASMGSLLLCGGAAGQRYCLPHSSIMIHQPSGGYFGQQTDIAIHAREILRVRGQLERIYERHLTGKGEKKLKAEEIGKMMERDHFMGALEALDMGIVDRVLERRGEEREGKDTKDQNREKEK